MKMTMVIAGQNSCCCVYTNTNIMTTKFICNMFQTEPNGQPLKTHNSWHQNYMGVVSRLPIASPGHRLMETHYVH